MNGQIDPIPSAAAGIGPFEVKHQPVVEGGACRMPRPGGAGVFRAPLSNDSLEAIAIRQHEYGHLIVERLLLIDQKSVHRMLDAVGVDDGWYQASLDVFVNSYMLCRGSPEILLLDPCPEVPVSVPRHVAAMLYVRAEALKCEAYLRNQVRSLLDFSYEEGLLLNNLAAFLQDRGRRGAYLDVYDLARRLQEIQRIFGPDPGPEPDEFTRMFAAAAPVPTRSTAPESEWGWMTLHTPLLSATQSLHSRARGQRPGGVGAFRYPHRAWLPVSDGRAFGQRLPTRRGTVLIDCSGSMELCASDLRRILSRSAGMTVALYASDPDSLRSGRLVISAKNGKLLSDARFQGLFGSGNVVDGPALRWLLRQSPPRFWVSDGCVTGVEDKVAANLSAEAAALVRRGAVRWFATVDEMLNTTNTLPHSNRDG